MDNNVDKSLSAITSFKVNFFTDFFIGNINQKYHKDCYKFIATFLDYFDIKSVNLNTGTNKLKYDIKYNEPLYLQTGNNPKIPQEIEKCFTPNAEAIKELKHLLKFFKKNNINSWNEQLKLLPHKTHLLYEEQNLKACLFMDLMYEILIQNKDNFLLGSARKKDIAANIRNAFSSFKLTIKYPSANQLIKKADTNCFLAEYYHGYLKTLIKNQEIYEISDAKSLMYPLPSKNNVCQTVMHYYTELLRYRFDPPKELLQFASSKDNGDIKKNANKENIELGLEYIKLYEQMGYLYFAEWINKYSCRKSMFNFLLNYKPYLISDNKNIFINTATFSKQPYINPTQNITNENVLNPHKIFPQSNDDGNITVDQRRILQYMLFSYLNYSFNSFLKSQNLFFTNKENVNNFILESFRINYILRHSTFFKLFHERLISKLNKTKHLNLKNIPPSFYTTTLALYLNKSHLEIHEKDILDKFNEYHSFVDNKNHIFNNCSYNTILKITDHLFALKSEAPNLNMPTHLIEEIQKYIAHFLKSGIDDDIWNEFDHELKKYYKSKK